MIRFLVTLCTAALAAVLANVTGQRLVRREQHHPGRRAVQPVQEPGAPRRPIRPRVFPLVALLLQRVGAGQQGAGIIRGLIRMRQQARRFGQANEADRHFTDHDHAVVQGSLGCEGGHRVIGSKTPNGWACFHPE